MLQTPIHLLDLPPEILILVLSHLDLPTLTSCLATNRRVKSIIDGSTLLQYRLAAQAACVEDNPWNETNSAQKLFALQKRQSYYTKPVPSAIRTMDLDHFNFDVYALSGGIFAGAEVYSGFLAWCSLETDVCVFQRLEFHGYIQDLALAVPEENLLAIVLTSESLLQSGGSAGAVKLRFYEMSTQAAHRMARQAVIEISMTDHLISDCAIDICDSKIALSVHCVYGKTRLLIYDWRDGSLLLDLSREYSTATFLSPDVISLAQRLTGTLELWNIHDQQSVPDGIVACPRIFLQLPQLAKSGSYTIHAVESNRKGQGSLASQEPFHSSFTDSILVFLVWVVFNDGTDVQMFLILPRRALLQLLPPAEEYQKELPWREWGPPIATWLHKNAGDTWPPITCGQRCAFAYPGPGRMRLLDFNPYTHRKVARTQRDAAGKEPRICSVSGEVFKMVPGISLGIFDEEVSSHMGCVVADFEFPTENGYNGVLLDENWIVGVKESDLDGKVSFDVWHLE
ncbi:hypothetical protein B0H16DRAFT_1881126 [Mycena metata]|uniref:F-box domain-containing protein n=1 Tax=Mycena metata TaxID=1033252 RepID=A0AAD7NRE5_9AGAR|nr:hypothetical protein B0H16DRAFT_1881126 [Mycena metata]